MLMLHGHPHIASHLLHTIRTPTKANQQCIAQEGFLFAEAFCISCTVVVKDQRQVVLVACVCHRVAALLLNMSGINIPGVNRT